MCIDLSSLDKFGPAITLSYQNKGSYGTSYGGCCSILLFIVFWSMFCTLMYEIFFNPNFSSAIHIEYQLSSA